MPDPDSAAENVDPKPLFHDEDSPPADPVCHQLHPGGSFLSDVVLHTPLSDSQSETSLIPPGTQMCVPVPDSAKYAHAAMRKEENSHDSGIPDFAMRRKERRFS